MKFLRIVHAKPNPTGKDRTSGFAPKQQLAAEWVDFTNGGNESYDLQGISFQHIAFQSGCRDGKWEQVMNFKGVLQPGEVVRVHSGSEIQLSAMYPEDAANATYHLFTGKNYIWNNDCGDTPGLWDGKVWIDKASYESYPLEGKVLIRQGDKLI